MVTVAVTELEFRKAEALFVCAAQEGCNCIWRAGRGSGFGGGHPRPGDSSRHHRGREIPWALYQGLSEGGVIARFGVGHDGVDKAQATAHGSCAPTRLGRSMTPLRSHHQPAIRGSAADGRAGSPVTDGEWSPQMGIELKRQDAGDHWLRGDWAAGGADCGARVGHEGDRL